MNKYFFTILGITCLFALSAPTAYAGSSGGSQQCQAIYGGGESCTQFGQITIKKTVKNPQTGVFVNNLGTNDAKFVPDSDVTFKLTVSNNSNTDVSGVTVKDVFPQFVSFTQGIGTFDNNTKTLTFTIDHLGVNEVRDFFIVGKVASQNQLPSGIVCLVNQATASVNDKISEDNAQFCVGENNTPNVVTNPTTTKGGLPVFPPAQVKTTPQTGPEEWSLISLIPTGLGGLILRRKSK